MKAVSQNEIISLVSDINAFADQAEELINVTQANYDANKSALLNRHQNTLSGFDRSYKEQCDSISTQAQKTVRDAKAILSEVDKLDSKLSKADKYYVKTKKKKEAQLAGMTSPVYAGASDYFTTLTRIQKDFNALFKKYSEDILPGLINGLNYLFSAQRKQDYQELIILRNTVSAFVKEIESALPSITTEKLASLSGTYQNQRRALLEQQQAEAAQFENNHLTVLDNTAGKICADLDAILPDEFVSYLAALLSSYCQNILRVNTMGTVQDEVLSMCFIDYPVDYFIQSSIVASVIKDKCASILVNGAIRLPAAMSVKDAPVWLIAGDNSSTTAVLAFSHAILFSFLSSCPVARLTYTVIDPENRGNSISPFFDARKKLPELFGEKIFIVKEDIARKISQLNEKIEDILQDKLGNQFESIFDYAAAHPEYTAGVELLVLYDFPKGFDDRTLSDLRNILRNGSKCGIYTVISYLPDEEASPSRELQQSLQSILALSTVIQQDGQSFLYRGLPLSCYTMPEKAEFAKFFSKYMLIFEGIKNRGIAFSPLIKKLVEAKDSLELDEHIAYISTMMSGYEKAYAQVPEINAAFPSLVTLGTVLYPADIFADSISCKRIEDTFGRERTGNTETSSYVELPLTFDLKNSFNLFLNCSGTTGPRVLDFSHHVIWSFLSFMPVTKVNVCVFDSEQRGNSILPFLDFRKRSPETFDQKIYTSSEAMYDRLLKIDGQIDDFIQEKLGNRYLDILDYNSNTPNRAEPVTLLILYDFPGGMDGRSIDLLTNILRNGNKCGVFTIICYNSGIQFSRYESIDERLEQIEKYCVSIDYRDGHFSLLPYNLQINLPSLMDNRLIDAFISDYVEKSEAVKKRGLSLKDIITGELFSLDSSRSLRIPIGIGDGDSIVSLTLGEGSSHHGLIAGATGSGKSTLLHTLIMSSMLHYSPDQLHLYLMDFKSGTEFKIYESVKLPHIQLLALDAMQEFGESILENLVAEMERRANAFKAAGGVTKIKDYIETTGQPMPRILVIMDEFQILFNDSSNRKVAMNCAELTKRIVTEGRAFGIHLIMATQSTKVISDLTLSHGTIEQMRVRIGLKCGENDARYLFSDQSDAKALMMMKGPIGTAVMNLDYTEQSNIGFRTAYCDDKTLREFLGRIGSAYADRPSSLQIFEGSRTTNLLDYFRSLNIGKTDALPVRIHMGTLIKVAPPFSITVDNKRKHNLLICGSNEKMANTILQNYIVSALLHVNASVYCVDGDTLVGDDGSADFYNSVSAASPRFKAAGNRGDIIHLINEVYQKYLAWKKQNSDEVVFVIIHNLQFLDIVKSMFKGEMIDENEFLDEDTAEPIGNIADPFAAVNSFLANRESGDDMPAGEKLIKLIENGSGFGIHFVVTSLEYQTVRECMYYGENILTKFPERIIFSLGANDADTLIENVSVSGLRDNTVYFTDGVRNTFQMKPYIPPDSAALSGLLG